MSVLKFDKPTVKNTAPLMMPIISPSADIAEEYRNRIINSPNCDIAAKSIWYVSENGDDASSGKSPLEAWKSLEAINSADIKEGDAVLFERGGVYRGNIIAKSGVYYGAYGEGDKPCIYGSQMNYANADWQNEGGNIWSAIIPVKSDIGIVVLNHGEGIGYRKKELSDLKAENDYFYGDGKAYIYSEASPSEKFNSIEMGDLKHLFLICSNIHDVVIDNITFKYGGAHGILTLGHSYNITVKNCEVGWIGGCYLPNYKNGYVRYGNGIESWDGVDNMLVEDCWIYQIYDSGISHQGNGNFLQSNITYRRNLVEYTSFGSIEYWAHDENKNSMENIIYADNILRFAGYGWGDTQRPDKVGYHIYSTGSMDHKCKNFKITGNVMDMSARALIRCTSKVGTYPEIEGNTYIQTDGGLLGAYGDTSNENVIFSGDVAETVREVFGDRSAKIKILKSGDEL